jgi:hypothetical protein
MIATIGVQHCFSCMDHAKRPDKPVTVPSSQAAVIATAALNLRPLSFRVLACLALGLPATPCEDGLLAACPDSEVHLGTRQ